MNKFDRIIKLITEDSVDAPSTSVMPGSELRTASPPTNAEFTTLHDLLKYKNGMDVGENKKKILGVPLQNILEELVRMWVQGQELKARFHDAAQNPVYRDKPELKPVFDRLEQNLKTIQTQIKSISRELDNLTLDS